MYDTRNHRAAKEVSIGFDSRLTQDMRKLYIQ